VSQVATFEFHARTAFFEHQLTTRTMAEMFEPLAALYLDRLESSPALVSARGEVLKDSRGGSLFKLFALSTAI
jgi:hypothetical protein